MAEDYHSEQAVPRNTGTKAAVELMDVLMRNIETARSHIDSNQEGGEGGEGGEAAGLFCGLGYGAPGTFCPIAYWHADHVTETAEL